MIGWLWLVVAIRLPCPTLIDVCVLPAFLLFVFRPRACIDWKTRRALVDRSWEYREDAAGSDPSRSSFWSTGLFRGGYLSKPATVGPPSTFNRSNPHLATLRRHRSNSSTGGGSGTEAAEVDGTAETAQIDGSGLDIPFAQPVEEHDLSPPRGSDGHGGMTPTASSADPACGPYDIFYLGIIDIFQTSVRPSVLVGEPTCCPLMRP